MILNIFKNADAAFDLISGAVPVHVNSSIPKSAVSLQIWWQDIQGTIDGKIKIYASNVKPAKKKIAEVNINSAENADDAVFFQIIPVYRFIYFEYVKNSISSGKINASLFLTDRRINPQEQVFDKASDISGAT